MLCLGSSLNPHEVDTFIIPILEMKKRDKEVSDSLRSHIHQAAGLGFDAVGLALDHVKLAPINTI